jgi:hypothetical protein
VFSKRWDEKCEIILVNVFRFYLSCFTLQLHTVQDIDKDRKQCFQVEPEFVLVSYFKVFVVLATFV